MNDDLHYHIGILILCIHIPCAQSLKDKRMVLRSLKDRVRKKFNVSLAEIGSQEKWQVSICGFAVIGTDRGYSEGVLDHILKTAYQISDMEVIDHQKEFC